MAQSFLPLDSAGRDPSPLHAFLFLPLSLSPTHLEATPWPSESSYTFLLFEPISSPSCLPAPSPLPRSLRVAPPPPSSAAAVPILPSPPLRYPPCSATPLARARKERKNEVGISSSRIESPKDNFPATAKYSLPPPSGSNGIIHHGHRSNPGRR
ncbi:hypothetical protein LZ31DRAFT_159062 [Colletotrichum somersetense]|nr:hypothetical protein LZ31DRAFT_159062 [Colletotrichum somersetense]